MTQQEFNIGFKLLKRFIKEEKIYNEFLRHTVKNKKLYKKNLFKSFNTFSYFDNWGQFFRYTLGIGRDYEMYGHGKILDFHKEWIDFMNKHHFDGLKYY